MRYQPTPRDQWKREIKDAERAELEAEIEAGEITVEVLPPQYDPEPPVRPVFKFIHGPVTRHGCRQSCYTVQIGAPA